MHKDISRRDMIRAMGLGAAALAAAELGGHAAGLGRGRVHHRLDGRVVG